jgi:hypothetical protein
MAQRFEKKLKRPQTEDAPWERFTRPSTAWRERGLLETWMGEATPQRGGRAKRMVRVTGRGVSAAKEFYDAVTRVSRGASWAESR